MSYVDPVKSKLFRQEALNARRDSYQGSVLLTSPVSSSLISAFAFAVFVLIAGIVVFCSYTRRVTVSGQVTPSLGILRVYPAQAGIVVEKHVTEGQHVQAGSILYVLSSERDSVAIGGTQIEISKQISYRKASLDSELESARRMQAEEASALAVKLRALRSQAATFDAQISVQESRVKLSKNAASRYRELSKDGYVSEDQRQQKEEEHLEHRSRRVELQRQRSSVEQEIRSAENDLRKLPIKYESQIAQLERLKSTSSQEYAESESKRRLVVSAAAAGTITSVLTELGQIVDPSRPVLGLLPDGARMLVDLYATSRTIGFVKPGDDVLLRYHAYPYQKFGKYDGKVISVAQTPMTPQELAAISGGVPGLDPTKGAELYYRIVVAPKIDQVTAYGRAMPLRSGMTVDVDLLQDTRRIYEWILEPVLSLRGTF
ncbi:secretion protein [Pandoraea pneumonica]|uniref:Secretion protein n=1 Tax=Pandoraea pneumonica TaxID=2508299 RepID=A0A5E4XSY5_9BURK|nr:HlyD family efflux transporter periplasmic adaptor subunit [Pandoraea pneumonica]VVE39215.1 secretion protein [Pandoraea pneumonica]